MITSWVLSIIYQNIGFGLYIISVYLWLRDRLNLLLILVRSLSSWASKATKICVLTSKKGPNSTCPSWKTKMDTPCCILLHSRTNFPKWRFTSSISKPLPEKISSTTDTTLLSKINSKHGSMYPTMKESQLCISQVCMETSTWLTFWRGTERIWVQRPNNMKICSLWQFKTTTLKP